MKLSVNLAVATFKEYRILENIQTVIKKAAELILYLDTLTETIILKEAIKEFNILITDI
jgi:hypothetical protein